MLQQIISRVRNELPQFNDQLLIGQREKEVGNLPQFIANRFNEACSMADPNLKLINYSVVSPEDRLQWELVLKSKKRKNIFNIRIPEAVLFMYNFMFYDQGFTVPLYIPYIYENSSIIVDNLNKKSYESLPSFSEKLFSVRRNNEGVTIKVIRSPIAFWRNTNFQITELSTNKTLILPIITCRIYARDPKNKKIKPTILLYLLCKFTLQEILQKLNLPNNALEFIEREEFNENFLYFRLKENILIRVPHELSDSNPIVLEVIATICYTLSTFKNITIENLNSNSMMLFRLILGRIVINSNTKSSQLLNCMDKHIHSVDSYLDEYTRSIFNDEGIEANDIYDILFYIFVNIKNIIINHPNNNMFNKRIEYINHAITDNPIRTLNLSIYSHDARDDRDHMFKTFKRIMSIHPHAIIKCLSRSDNIRYSPAIYGDNWLLTILSKVVKRLSMGIKRPVSKKQNQKGKGNSLNLSAIRFDPSMPLTESLIGYGKQPAVNSLINPFAQINSNGGFVRPIDGSYDDLKVLFAEKSNIDHSISQLSAELEVEQYMRNDDDITSDLFDANDEYYDEEREEDDE